jgi:hypothetical protein
VTQSPASAAAGPVAARYDALVASGAIERDPARGTAVVPCSPGTASLSAALHNPGFGRGGETLEIPAPRDKPHAVTQSPASAAAGPVAARYDALVAS